MRSASHWATSNVVSWGRWLASATSVSRARDQPLRLRLVRAAPAFAWGAHPSAIEHARAWTVASRVSIKSSRSSCPWRATSAGASAASTVADGGSAPEIAARGGGEDAEIAGEDAAGGGAVGGGAGGSELIAGEIGGTAPRPARDREEVDPSPRDLDEEIGPSPSATNLAAPCRRARAQVSSARGLLGRPPRPPQRGARRGGGAWGARRGGGLGGSSGSLRRRGPSVNSRA